MSSSLDPGGEPLPTGQVLARGFAAAHGALLGALYLALLQAPVQVTGAFAQALQGSMFGPDRQPDLRRLVLSLSLSAVLLVLALAVFFLFPLVQGGILGQVRDRLESPHQPPGRFGDYGRAHYARLLGSQGLFLLVMLAVLVPVMCLGAGMVIRDYAGADRAIQPYAEAGPAEVPTPEELNRQFLLNPVMLTVIVVASLLASAVGMVYWMANSIVVAEQEGVLVAWQKAFDFCRRNFSTVLAVWLLSFAVGVVIAPLGLAGQFGFVRESWLLVALALGYSALVGYWGVILAGLTMSLYLGGRGQARRPEPEPSLPA
jgi:hypothetical protein